MGARSSRGVSWLALLLPIILLAPGAAWSGPLIIQESQQLTAEVPLNGPVVGGGDRIYASGSFKTGFGFFEYWVFLFERSADGSFIYTRTLAAFTVPEDRGSSHLSLSLLGSGVGVAIMNRAFVIELTNAGWLTTELPRPAEATAFGSDIAGAAVVGGTSGGNAAAFVYRKNELGAWSFETTLLGGPVPSDDYMGPDVESDGYVLIGSAQELSGPDAPGRLYVYSRQEDGSWLNIERLFDWGSGFGAGGLAAIGGGYIAFDNGQRGAAPVFWEEERDSFTFLDRVQALDSLMSGLPSALALTRLGPSRLLTLALGLQSDEDRGQNTGSVTLWQPQDGVEFFAPVAKLLASDATPGLALGRFVRFNGNEVLAQDGNQVYVFRLPASFAQPDLIQDDFQDGNAAGWLATSAGWSVVSSQGSRVYRQVKETFDTRSTLTNVDWANVAIEADVRPLLFNGADGFAALLTRYTDDRNYYYVSLRNTNTLRLIKRVNGTSTTLASTSLAIPVNKSYRVRLEAIGTWLRVYVDGRLRLEARDSTLKHGTVGFRSFFARAEFDNVVVSPSPATTLLHDAFARGLSKWTLQPAANWSIVGSDSAAVLRQSGAAGGARAISGIRYDVIEPTFAELADHVVSARARPLSFTTGQPSGFGLIARYQDDLNYTYMTVNRNGSVSLRKLNDGVVQVFDTTPLTVQTGVWYTLRLEAVGTRLRGYVNGSLVLEAVDPVVDQNSTRGLYGLVTSQASVDFDDVRVTEP